MSSWDHLLQRFEFVHRQVMNGRKRVRKQREVIAKLESEGAGTADAEHLLEAFEATLKLFEEQYQSIKQEIDARLSK